MWSSNKSKKMYDKDDEDDNVDEWIKTTKMKITIPNLPSYLTFLPISTTSKNNNNTYNSDNNRDDIDNHKYNNLWNRNLS